MDFNTLPKEMKDEILKYNPSSRQISTDYGHNPVFKQLYNQHYCDLPISKKEFLNYINTHHPENFILYLEDRDRYGFPRFSIYELEKKDYDYYRQDLTVFNIIPIDNEYTFDIQYYDENITLSTYDFKFNFIDLQTMMDIYQQRGCPYKESLIKELDSDYRTGNDMLDAFNTLKNILYIHQEWIMTFGDNHVSIIEEPLFYFIFNRKGKMIGVNDEGNIMDVPDTIEFVHDYESEKRDLMDWINK